MGAGKVCPEVSSLCGTPKKPCIGPRSSYAADLLSVGFLADAS